MFAIRGRTFKPHVTGCPKLLASSGPKAEMAEIPKESAFFSEGLVRERCCASTEQGMQIEFERYEGKVIDIQAFVGLLH